VFLLKFPEEINHLRGVTDKKLYKEINNFIDITINITIEDTKND